MSTFIHSIRFAGRTGLTMNTKEDVNAFHSTIDAFLNSADSGNIDEMLYSLQNIRDSINTTRIDIGYLSERLSAILNRFATVTSTLSKADRVLVQ